MFERSWAAVPPVLFTTDGSTNGYITVVSTLGFRVKAQVVIQATGQPNLTLQCKKIISPTKMIVGPLTGAITNYKVDLSDYTLANGAFIYQDQQAKVSLRPEDIVQAIYNQEPICSISTTSVDGYGNEYSNVNPAPTNIVPTSQIPFTLGALALPALINNYINTLTYTQVTSDTIGTEEVLTFFDGSTNVGEINLSQTEDGWVLDLGVAEEDFLLLEDGSFFVLEDDSGGILLE